MIFLLELKLANAPKERQSDLHSRVFHSPLQWSFGKYAGGCTMYCMLRVPRIQTFFNFVTWALQVTPCQSQLFVPSLLLQPVVISKPLTKQRPSPTSGAPDKHGVEVLSGPNPGLLDRGFTCEVRQGGEDEASGQPRPSASAFCLLLACIPCRWRHCESTRIVVCRCSR